MPEIIIKMHHYIGINSPTDSCYPGLLNVVYQVVEGRTLLGKKKKKFWHYYDDYCVDDYRVIKWHDEENHQKYMAQKAQIKKELMPIAWHPSRYWDWCMSEDEKKERQKLWP